MTSWKRSSGPLRRAVLMLLLAIAPSMGCGEAKAPVSAAVARTAPAAVAREIVAEKIPDANVPGFVALPPAAQGALDRGIVAARIPDYPLAFRFFQDARRIAPAAPVIYLNLGVAESKIPGRELRAIAWFGAYVAAFPTASNAAAVREQMVALDIRSQSNFSRLIRSVQEALSQFPGRPWSNSSDVASVGDLAELLVKAGNGPAALTMVGFIRDDEQKRSLRTRISIAQGVIGDVAGALRANDVAGALEAASLIPNVRWRGYALLWITNVQVEGADIAAAQTTLNLIEDTFYRSSAQAHVALARATSGDMAGGQEALLDALRLAELVVEPGKSDLLRIVSVDQAKAGDFAGAGRTADHIQDDKYRQQARDAIAEAQAVAGRTNAPSSPRPPTPGVRARRPGATRVSEWLTTLDDDDLTHDCPLNTAPFLDLAGSLKSIPPAASPQAVFANFLAVAKTVGKGQDCVHRMLQRAAGR